MCLIGLMDPEGWSMMTEQGHGGMNSWELTSWTISRRQRWLTQMAQVFWNFKGNPQRHISYSKNILPDYSQTVLPTDDQVFKHESMRVILNQINTDILFVATIEFIYTYNQMITLFVYKNSIHLFFLSPFYIITVRS